MPAANPHDRVLAATIGVHTSWAKTPDRPARTANARAALDARFLAEADGDPIRAAHLRKAHYAHLALRSARARRLAAACTVEADAADTELADYIRKIVDAAPPLSPAARDRLAILLRGGPDVS